MKICITALALAVASGHALAQTVSDDAKRLAELERKIEILSRELEAQKQGSQVVEASEGKHGLAPAASKVYLQKSGLSVGGYGELLYENFASRLENGSYSPKANTVDFYRQILYVGYKFSDRMVLNTEVEYEHAYTAGSQTVTTTTINGQKVVTDVKTNRPGDVELELAYLDFLITPGLNVRAGMVLVPMGFINETHEPPTYLGAARPALERNLIPTTWRGNGVGVHGDLGKGFSYRAYVMEGLDASKFTRDGLKGGRQQGAKAAAESWAITGRLDWSPIPGTVVGTSFFKGNSQQGDNLPSLPTRVMDLHAEWRHRGFQARALWVDIEVEESGLPASGTLREVGTRQRGHYLELGYDVLNGNGTKALIPFIRREQMDRHARVAAGVARDRALDETLTTAGLVFKPIPQIAIKGDFSRITNGAHTGRNQYSLALGYYF